MEAFEIEQVLTATRPPWQSPLADCTVGAIRRECLDPVVVLNEAQLRRLLESYFADYHRARTDLSLDKDPPESREVEPPDHGETVGIPEIGDRHHRYARRAA